MRAQTTPTGRIRLTVGQAVVRYLQAQHSERDGERRRLVPAVFGIFGHGNVAGLGQALVEPGEGLPYYQAFNEQSMVHTAASSTASPGRSSSSSRCPRRCACSRTRRRRER